MKVEKNVVISEFIVLPSNLDGFRIPTKTSRN